MTPILVSLRPGFAVGHYVRRAELDLSSSMPRTSLAGLGRTPKTRFDSSRRHCSSLPGWPMPPSQHLRNPPAAHVVDYLTVYEERYQLPVSRLVRIKAFTGTATTSYWTTRPAPRGPARDQHDRHLVARTLRNVVTLCGRVTVLSVCAGARGRAFRG
ncbi:hypothetical protein GCM10023178_02400 [Actinomadura luteofluorescens]